jgi:hypothetical protein
MHESPKPGLCLIARPGGNEVGFADGLHHFFALDGDSTGCVNPEAHHIAPRLKNGDDNVLTDEDFFIDLACKYQHSATLSQRITALIASH